MSNTFDGGGFGNGGSGGGGGKRLSSCSLKELRIESLSVLERYLGQENTREVTSTLFSFQEFSVL